MDFQPVTFSGIKDNSILTAEQSIRNSKKYTNCYDPIFQSLALLSLRRLEIPLPTPLHPWKNRRAFIN